MQGLIEGVGGVGRWCDRVPGWGEHIRLIDFDDSGWGWYLFEVAASLFPHVNQPFFDTLLAEYVAGYRTERQLSKEHEELIPAFIMLRGFTYLGWLMTRAGSMPNADQVVANAIAALHRAKERGGGAYEIAP